jgi:Protein of unknown function (DUF3349)
MTHATDNGDATRATAAARSNVVQRIIRWLRAGYPDGVPQQDYVALLGILRRTLTPGELAHVVGELVDEAAAGQHLMTEQLVQQRITDIVKGPIDESDVDRVSSRLAAVGWPLGSPVEDAADPLANDGARTGLVTRVADWLRAGYPAGLPERDFVPLVALLLRRLSDEEVREVSRRLVDDGAIPSDRADIGSAIAKVTSELPSEADIARVRAYLSEHGWPLDFAI